VAPSAYQKLVGNGGEVDVSRASYALGTNFTLSSNSTTSLEDVVSALPARSDDYPRPWFQLYFLRSRASTIELIRRAERAGYEALVLTVDTVVLGNRYHDRKTPLTLPEGMKLANLASIQAGGVSKARLLMEAKTAADAKRVIAENLDLLVDASLEWHEIIPWLRSHTKMKIILKGIMTAEDATRSLEAGVDAIVVSNHGGRQLDGVPSTLEALPEISEAVKGKIPIIFDGGISKGTDVFKALALGADLCLIGRSALWGLAYDGQKGVEAVLHILERELWRTMALGGAKSLNEISRSMLGRARRDGFGIARL
jgi:(S)-2-hydroxy-acid oxidase